MKSKQYISCTKTIAVKVEKKTAEEFNEITRKLSINKSSLLQKWIELYIERNKDKENDPSYLLD
jgi:metal-responsive CopG/Arc/MetJ family transcriptional regulator